MFTFFVVTKVVTFSASFSKVAFKNYPNAFVSHAVIQAHDTDSFTRSVVVCVTKRREKGK